MRNIALIAWNDLRLLLRERSILINMFLVSLVMVGVIGLANSAAMSEGSDPAIYIDLIDHDQTDLSQQFIDGMASGAINVWTGPINLQDGSEYAAAGAVATDDQIWYLPLLLEGMEGPSE